MASPGNKHIGSENRAIPARRFTARFSETTPRHWCGGDPFLTHFLNAYTLLVPGNEGYYIRTLKLRMPRISDPGMRVMVAQFLLQEGQHGAGHHRCWRMLEAQGYQIAGFHKPVDYFLYRILEPITPLPLRIAMVSCVEHVNAYMAHEYLGQRLLRDATPELQALFEWHFAEEIEHKHVVFDVLNSLPGRYALRVTGAVLVLPLFYLLMGAGALRFLHQDRSLWRRDTWSRIRQHLFSRDHMFARTLKHAFNYLRPGFHPWQLDDSALAREAIERHSLPEHPALRPLPHSRAA